MQDVDAWLIADDTEFNMNYEKIVQSVLHDFNNTPSLEEIKLQEEKNLLSHCLFSITNKSKFFRETGM